MASILKDLADFFLATVGKLFGKQSSALFVQLIRYTIVGGVAFLADFALLALLTEYGGFPYLTSACLSFTAGLIVNYSLSIVWVFGSTSQTRETRIAEFVLFSVVGVLGLGMNALIMWVSTELLGVFYLVSKIVSTIIVFAWNFFARRNIISHFPNKIWKAELTLNRQR